MRGRPRGLIVPQSAGRRPAWSRAVVAYRQVNMDVRPESASSSPSEWSGRPSSFEVRGAVPVPGPAPEQLRVLLASAGPQDESGVSASLEQLGHAVVARAGSAAEAATRVATLRPDVALLDAARLDAPAG